MVEPTGAVNVRRIFREWSEGRRYSAIARRLNAERVPTRHGASWTANHIRRIVTGRLRAIKGPFVNDLRPELAKQAKATLAVAVPENKLTGSGVAEYPALEQIVCLAR